MRRTSDGYELQIETSTRLSAMWAAASGDFDPIHYDDAFARRQRLPGTIVNGRLKVALLSRAVAAAAGPRGRVLRLAARHQDMDPIGMPLKVCAVALNEESLGDERRVQLEIWIENTQGKKTALGSATVSIPAHGSER